MQDNVFLKGILIDVIKNEKRHQWYERTVDKAELYTQLTTGEGADKLLKKFSRRESDAAFNQRVEITQEIHTSIIDSLSQITSKIPRSSGVAKTFNYTDEAKEEKLEEILNKFWGIDSWGDWLDTRFFELNDTDPNAFMVFEFGETDGTKHAQPYPFEVSSEEAIYYQYINKILQYLVVENTVEFIEQDKVKEGFKWTIYGQNNSIKIVQIPFASVQVPPQVKPYEIFDVDGSEYMYYEQSLFIVLTSKGYSTGETVPAFQVGYKRDKYTKGETFTPHWNAAIPYLMKSVKAVSELDLTSALHAFPQKVSYESACSKCDGTGRVVSHDEQTEGQCTECAGKGRTTHTSAQDEITIALPPTPNPDDIIDLKSLIHYVDVPTEILKWQEEYVENLKVQCFNTVFNKEVWNKEDATKTATGVMVNTENVYDSLYPYAIKYVNIWKFGVEIISLLTNLNNELEVYSNVNKDLKLKTKIDYLEERKLAKDAGSSQRILREIDVDVMRLTHEDSPENFNKYITQEKFFPYSGKTGEEIAQITSSLPLTDKKRVLWMDYGSIFDAIELEYGMQFYEFDPKKQADIIDKQVDNRVQELSKGQEVTFEAE